MKKSLFSLIICLLSSLLYFKISDYNAYFDIYNKINEVSFQVENNLFEKVIILESTRALLTKYKIKYTPLSTLNRGEKFIYCLSSSYYSSLKNQNIEIEKEYEFIYI